MPIYEFTCGKCGAETEILVPRQNYEVRCPQCGSKKMEKKLSVFSSSSNQGGSACGDESCSHRGGGGCCCGGGCCHHHH
ncbi:MAG: zinc ribbon domain-containing protein [Verrucomicrobia bacterium]|nr:zinc ribbon domain-containing protein [Verrucomicrobiota bacterium]MBR5605889.1 zinc ribbon domain-containing protein [Verrucomicrobiota bacterium]MBR5690621.1 zinc ribbon domain-containing protein [Verrucomicrobiota bacterium]MBR5737848.1 zinc ribbon domain-containing protein [Verrucomicrobiota bacterium]MBR5977734.1 zinc ribbon domain-containing protein [Verrucomicrobiota bacterium]